MKLDIKTIIFIIGLIHLIQVFVFLHQYKVNKIYKGIGWFLAWSASEFVGFIIVLFRDFQTIFPLVVIIQNSAIIIGLICIYIGFMQFVEKKIKFIIIYLFFTLYILLFLFFLFIDNNIQIRSEIVNGALAFISFAIAFSILKYSDKSIRTSAIFISTTQILHGFVMIYRFISIAMGENSGDPFSTSLMNLITFIDVLIISLLWTFGFVIMINQKLNFGIKEAKQHFETIFKTSPDGAVITRLSDGLILDINAGFSTITGYSAESIIGKSVFDIELWVNPEDRNTIINELKKNGFCHNFESKFRNRNGEFLTGLLSAKILTLNNENHIISITRDISERKKIEDEIKRLNEELEKRVTDRTKELESISDELKENQTALMNIVEDLNEKTNQLILSKRELEAANKELEAFSYSVSHDLRAPLRSIDGFSLALMEDYYDNLDINAKDYLERIRNSTKKMDSLIDSMLKLSRVTRFELKLETVNLSKIVSEILKNLKNNVPERKTDFYIEENVTAEADGYLLSIVLENLIGNSWKYTSKKDKSVIEFRTIIKDKKTIYSIKDNGVGFDMKYVDKLFGAFQRLHSVKDFPGTGIGLATAQRVIRRHGGEIWAESVENKETTFYFTLK